MARGIAVTLTLAGLVLLLVFSCLLLVESTGIGKDIARGIAANAEARIAEANAREAEANSRVEIAKWEAFEDAVTYAIGESQETLLMLGILFLLGVSFGYLIYSNVRFMRG